MTLPPFDYARPASLDEATDLLARGDARVLAGGQSLVPALAARLPGGPRPGLLVDLYAIPGLDAIEPLPDGGVRIGAMARQRTVELSPLIAQRAPLLAEATAWIGHPSTRNRGTVVGSLAYAEPAAEIPSVAVALDAVAEIAGPGGARRTATAAELLGASPATPTTPAAPQAPANPPVRRGTALTPGELIVALTIPARSAAERTAWVEHAPRRYDLPLVGVAAVVRADGTARLVFAGVGPAPVTLQLRSSAPLRGGRTTGVPAVAELRSFEGHMDPESTGVPAPDPLRARIAGTLARRALRQALRGPARTEAAHG